MPDGSLILPTLVALFDMKFVLPVFILGFVAAVFFKLIKGGI